MHTSITVDEACELSKRKAEVVFLDVREPDECAVIKIEGSLHLPLAQLVEEFDSLKLEKDKTVICVCRSGRRSSIAAEFLRSQGITALNLEGGMRDWAKHRRTEGLISDEDYKKISAFLGQH